MFDKFRISVSEISFDSRLANGVHLAEVVPATERVDPDPATTVAISEPPPRNKVNVDAEGTTLTLELKCREPKCQCAIVADPYNARCLFANNEQRLEALTDPKLDVQILFMLNRALLASCCKPSSGTCVVWVKISISLVQSHS